MLICRGTPNSPEHALVEADDTIKHSRVQHNDSDDSRYRPCTGDKVGAELGYSNDELHQKGKRKGDSDSLSLITSFVRFETLLSRPA